MYGGWRIAVVMPAYNVEGRVAAAVRSVPAFVDEVIVIDDASTDRTARVLSTVQRPDLLVIQHEKNRGVGAAIATGYRMALARDIQAVVVMAGDGQMDPSDLTALLEPLVRGEADYVKGNRFRHRDIWRAMPTLRLLGNIMLSLVTKVTSGYWQIFDSQCGYTAISRHALQALDGTFFPRYGYPNDLLARLHVVGVPLKEVPVRPVYEGQTSGIRWWTVIYPIFFILIFSMMRRIWHQRLRWLFNPVESPDAVTSPAESPPVESSAAEPTSN